MVSPSLVVCIHFFMTIQHKVRIMSPKKNTMTQIIWNRTVGWMSKSPFHSFNGNLYQWSGWSFVCKWLANRWRLFGSFWLVILSQLIEYLLSSVLKYSVLLILSDLNFGIGTDSLGKFFRQTNPEKYETGPWNSI